MKNQFENRNPVFSNLIFGTETDKGRKLQRPAGSQNIMSAKAGERSSFSFNWEK